MDSYYTEKLSAERLQRCYELGGSEIQRFLEVENNFVKALIRSGNRVLELGCGYGRVLRDLESCDQEFLMGIDISFASLNMAQEYLIDAGPVFLARMNGARLALTSGIFDLVCCIQNGISAFHEDQGILIREAVRVARPGGLVVFSSYAAEFWDHRLEWFRAQARHGLLGEIDEARTGDGQIICKDGFTATTVSPERFAELAGGLGQDVTTQIVGGCSVFCVIKV